MKQELNQKNEEIFNIKKELESSENKNKQLVQQNNDKELELNKITLDLEKIKSNESKKKKM